MHTKNDYKFDTKEEAEKFADTQRSNKSPDEDKYIYGPFFHDDDEIFKSMMWASKGLKYWVVSVEIYC